MVPSTQNRLLPILVGLVLVALLLIALRTCRENATAPAPLSAVPTPPSADADTPADTIKTLTANVASMTAAVDALRQDNANLKKDNQALLNEREQIEHHLTERLDQNLSARSKAADADAAEHSSALSALTARVDALANSFAEHPASGANGDLPVGLGLDADSAAREDLTWIDPLDGAAPSASAASQRPWTDGAGDHASDIAHSVEAQVATVQDRPVYTVPRNATLIGSTAMTALVGRVPVQGQVRDPMPFKVITGADNLAANGLSVPGVHGMVWSGTAVGDWTLSCVTGRLDSVTFVFDDGTIRTVSTEDKNLSGSDNAKDLAWISDDHGIPCISGERKTNAPAFLAQRVGVAALGAAGEAAAAAQTTTTVSDTGAVRNSLTGTLGPFMLGKTIAGGSDEIAKWLLERQAQSFDAVFVPAGVRLAIHVDRELLIDFERHGRRLAHDVADDAATHAHLD